MKIKISDKLKDLPRVDYRKLVPFQKNLKDLSKSNYTKLLKSLSDFGFIAPLITWSHKGEVKIIDAHQRHRVLMNEKIEPFELPYIEIEAKTEQEAKKKLLVISSQYGKISQEGLDEFAFDLDDDWLTDTINFDAIFADEVEEELKVGKTEDDAIPEDVEAITKLGDMWILGDHRLLCGDSTKKEDVERLMDGQKADMVFTDPPYNVDYEGKTKDKLKISNDKQSDDKFYSFLLAAFESMAGASKSGASIYICHADSEGLNFRKAMITAGWLQKQCIIWNKNCMVMGRQDYHWKHEPILYGWKADGSHQWYGDRTQTTIWDVDRPSRSELHPTTKPIELIDRAIKNSSKTEHAVLDLFLGSGSTLIACEKTNRKCYGMELDPHYCDVIVRRWSDFTGKEPSLVKEALPRLVIKKQS